MNSLGETLRNAPRTAAGGTRSSTEASLDPLGITEGRRQEALLTAGTLQSAIFSSANFSIIATDAKGVIQLFNVGAERMLGYTAADVMNKITPAEISDPQEVIARAKALSVELATPITPGFEALVFKASRGIEDIYELTYIRKDGSRFPAVVSVTALRDAENAIIGYLLIGTDNTARKQVEAKLLRAGALQNAIFNSANFSSIATDAKGVIQIFNVGAERMLGYTAAAVMNTITPADISDPQEVIARAKTLSIELNTPILPGFEALVFKASRGIEDIYELTYIRKDGSRFPAVVSVTALRDAHNAIIGYLLIGTDNTARKQAEEALLKAGALQNAIFNSANFSSIATDAKGVIQIFNVGAERMLGYTAAEVMNKITPAEISDPQEVVARAKTLSIELNTPILPGFEALVFKASRGIEDIYELTYIRKDGSRFPAVVSVTALRDAHNAIIGYLLIGTDNTARKQVEAEQEKLDQRLRDHQFYTRSLIESNIDAIMTTDLHGIITDVNKQMEALTGCTRDELIGAPFKSNFTDPKRAEASIHAVLREKKVTNYELTARARDGKETVVSYNATTFYDRERKLLGVFAAARDVTERKETEASLRRQVGLLDLSSDAIMVRDLKGVISSWNHGAEILYGFSKAEALGRTSLELLGTQFPRPLAELEARLRDAGSWTGELVHRRKDGRLVTVSTRWVLEISPDSTQAKVLESNTDITVRKAAETALLEGRQAAEAANRAKSQFLANMSHELRTPLNAIIGFSEILEDRTFGALNAKQGRYVTNILTSGRHLLQLINDILDLAKVETGKLELNAEHFDPARAVEDVLGILKALSNKKRIVLHTEWAPDLPALCADQSKFKQVLYNLLSNAVKFTPDGGTVTVKAEVRGQKSEIGPQKSEGEGWKAEAIAPSAIRHPPSELSSPVLRVAVADTGIGIKPEDHARIWSEFEQVDSTYARTQQGTGLGLSLTKKLVELHGGRIWLESDGIEGRGSTFVFELPLAPQARAGSVPPLLPPPAPEPAAPATGFEPGRPLVLVVDDNEQARALLETYLGGGGYDVAHARTAAQALQLARDLKPFAITLDILLPDRPGWEVLNELKASPQTRDIPVVIVSITDDLQLGSSLGAVDFLVKPICREELLAVIERAGSRRAQAVRIVLIVDDEPDAAEAVAEAIRAEGYAVLKATSGAQGIELALTARPDLLILDLLMPQMDGFEVVARLRANPLTAELPILIYTGKDLSAEERTTLQRQVQGIARKPAREQLLADLAHLAGRQRPKGSP